MAETPRAIHNLTLLKGLDRQIVGTLAASMTEETWPKGWQIIGPSDSRQSFRFVTAGRVKIVRSNPTDARELTLWLLGAGDGCFDFVSLFDGGAHAVSAWTLEEAHTLAAPMALWRRWLERFPTLRTAVHHCIAGRLRELTELTSDLALHDTPTRLAPLLRRHFEGGREQLLHGLPQAELAAMIGSVRVVVSRLLGQLQRDGAVRLHRGAIAGVDLPALMQRLEATAAPDRRPPPREL